MLWTVANDLTVQILVKETQETGGARYTHLAFGPQGIVAAAFGSTLHFLDSRNGALLEEVQVTPWRDLLAVHFEVASLFEPRPRGHRKLQAAQATNGLIKRAIIDMQCLVYCLMASLL